MSGVILANPCTPQNCCLWKTVGWPTLGLGLVFQAWRSKLPVQSIHVTLIESNKKKCAFLSEVVRTLEFTDVEIRPERFEEIRPETVLAEFITCRAVGEFKQLLRWSARRSPAGVISCFGLEQTTRPESPRTRGWTWQPAVRIPDSQRRFILIGRPIDEPPPAEINCERQFCSTWNIFVQSIVGDRPEYLRTLREIQLQSSVKYSLSLLRWTNRMPALKTGGRDKSHNTRQRRMGFVAVSPGPCLSAQNGHVLVQAETREAE